MQIDTRRAARLAALEVEINQFVAGIRHGQTISVAPAPRPASIEMSPTVTQQVARALGLRVA